MKQIVVATFGFLLMTSAQAASFDCTKAKSKLEKIICSNPSISADDDELAKSYTAAMKSLSPDGQAILKRGQVEWLRYVNFVCLKHHDPNEKILNPTWCVEQKYNRRLKDMKYAAVHIGPYLFSRIDYFYLNKVDDNGRPYDGQTSYPRIDIPITETTKKWNSLMAKTDKADGDDYCDGSSGDAYVYFEIASASEYLISAKAGGWTYCHGAAHGMGGIRGVNFVLKPEPHLLEARDLFIMATDTWEPFLTEKCLEVLRRKADGSDINEGMVQGIGTSPESWSLKPEGLVIAFNPYEVLAYAFGETQVLIPWKELDEFLSSPELIPK